MANRGVGAPLRRKEDDRFLRGRARYVRDIVLPGMWNAAFLRSDVAHARIKSITKPAGNEKHVFVAADLEGLNPIRAVSGIPGSNSADYPVLATDKVRYVGQPVAVAVAPTRAEAETLAQQIEVTYEPLPCVINTRAALEDNAPLVHEAWSNNVLSQLTIVGGDIDEAKRLATNVTTRRYRTSRQAMVPMEMRGTLAHYDERLDELVVHMSTQMPHLMQIGLARFFGIPQSQVRVISPDVGGGFGLKIFLDAECVATCWLARKLRRPIRWLQDCFEHLTGDANCREHHYDITAYTDDAGQVLGVDADILVDAGAYSIWPWTSGVEAGMAGGLLFGPYDIANYRAHAYAVATNKPPTCVYRGVARPGACFATELLIDAVARDLSLDPYTIRLDNLVKPEQMPYTSVTNKLYDTGDYPESLRRAAKLVNYPSVRDAGTAADGRLVGVGFATYIEQTAHGAPVIAAWGPEIVPGMETAAVRLSVDGGLMLEVAIHSHGQGLETTLAQVAHEILGIDLDHVAVRFGDTAISPFGTGTYASRSMVMAGGAVATGCRVLADRLRAIGAHLLQSKFDDVRVEDGEVVGPSGNVSFADIGRAWYTHPEDLPPDVDPGGLTVTQGYKAETDLGVCAYATHAAVVAVDPEIGSVELIDYAIVEDCGTMVNPMIVEGQILGGTAQGIGTALFEEALFDADGQPQAVTLADYHLPGAAELPDFKIEHMESPSPYTEFGMKGMGEGGAIAPPAAVTNAVNDALRDLGAVLSETPVTPKRILAALAAAQ